MPIMNMNVSILDISSEEKLKIAEFWFVSEREHVIDIIESEINVFIFIEFSVFCESQECGWSCDNEIMSFRENRKGFLRECTQVHYLQTIRFLHK